MQIHFTPWKASKMSTTYSDSSILVWSILSTDTKPSFVRSRLPAQLDTGFQSTVDLVENRSLVFIAIHTVKESINHPMSVKCKAPNNHHRFKSLIKAEKATSNLNYCYLHWFHSLFDYSIQSNESRSHNKSIL